MSYDDHQDAEKECCGPGLSGNAEQKTEPGEAKRDCNPCSEEALGGPQGFVYFFETEDGQYVKIGFTVDVNRRMGQLGALVPMRLIGYFPASAHTELWIHRKFKEQRHVGEWFRNCIALREFIANLGLIAAIAPQPREPSTPSSAAAAELGRRGGKRKVAKGFSKMTPETRAAMGRKGAAKRWGSR